MGHDIARVEETRGQECFCCRRQRPGKHVDVSSGDIPSKTRFVCNECDHVSRR